MKLNQLLAVLVCLTFTSLTWGQTNDEEVVKRTWRVGAHIQTGGSPVTNLLVTFPVPTDWPEQHVNVYEENIPDEARRADFRDTDGLRQMVATIPRIDSGTAVEIYVLMDISISKVHYPERTDHLVIPERPPREIRLYTSPSKLIENRKRVVKNKAKELTEDVDLAWDKAKAIYDFVTTEVTVEGKKVVGAEVALKHLKGAAEDRTNVFVALCRAIKIPSRIVWADNGEYAEFYLQDDTGEGLWYPAVLEGSMEFGQMTNPRVIIQKGDNVKVPEKGPRQRFVREFVTGSGRGAQPRVRFMRDTLPSRDRR